jgi:guanosine-3',5'-bis(diphosphate) 3'-pyrophosphohydrolase
VTDVAALLKALHFAARKHRDQRRKGRSASPYINHPIAVAELLVRVGGVTDTTTLLGAVLHDTVEDTQTTFEELEAEFGREVRDVVAELTDDKRLPSQERKRLQVERAAAASAAALSVSGNRSVMRASMPCSGGTAAASGSASTYTSDGS